MRTRLLQDAKKQKFVCREPQERTVNCAQNIQYVIKNVANVRKNAPKDWIVMIAETRITACRFHKIKMAKTAKTSSVLLIVTKRYKNTAKVHTNTTKTTNYALWLIIVLIDHWTTITIGALDIANPNAMKVMKLSNKLV
jgi:hypothetical protein